MVWHAGQLQPGWRKLQIEYLSPPEAVPFRVLWKPPKAGQPEPIPRCRLAHYAAEVPAMSAVAAGLDRLAPGLRAEYFALTRTPEHYPDWSSQRPSMTTVTPTVDLTIDKNGVAGIEWMRTNAAARWRGFLHVRKAMAVQFLLKSDDRSRLYLHGCPVINNEGLHATQESAAIVPLTAGLHPIEIWYFQAGGDGRLALRWMRPQDSRPEIIPPQSLFHEPRELPRMRFEPAETQQLSPGLIGTYYAPQFRINGFPDWSKLKPAGRKLNRTVDLTGDFRSFAGIQGLQRNFAARWQGCIKITEGGRIRFHVLGDDWSRLFIGNRLVVKNDRDRGRMGISPLYRPGVHTRQVWVGAHQFVHGRLFIRNQFWRGHEASGTIDLEPGVYPLDLWFAEGPGPGRIRLSWQYDQGPKVVIPAEHLFHLPKHRK
jgi:hypothetical protein